MEGLQTCLHVFTMISESVFPILMSTEILFYSKSTANVSFALVAMHVLNSDNRSGGWLMLVALNTRILHFLNDTLSDRQ